MAASRIRKQGTPPGRFGSSSLPALGMWKKSECDWAFAELASGHWACLLSSLSISSGVPRSSRLGYWYLPSSSGRAKPFTSTNPPKAEEEPVPLSLQEVPFPPSLSLPFGSRWLLVIPQGQDRGGCGGTGRVGDSPRAHMGGWGWWPGAHGLFQGWEGPAQWHNTASPAWEKECSLRLREGLPKAPKRSLTKAKEATVGVIRFLT